MFESLSDKLANAFKKFKNKGKLTEADVKEGMREIKLALLEADVNFKVVREFIKTVTDRAGRRRGAGKSRPSTADCQNRQ